MLKRSHKPVVLVREQDGLRRCRSTPGIYEFYSLGLGDPIAALGHPRPRHGRNARRVHRNIFRPRKRSEEEDDLHPALPSSASRTSASPRSSICVLGENRVIVSGYGRHDARRRGHRAWRTNTASISSSTPPASAASPRWTSRIEKFSVMRAQLAVERADVCHHHDRRARGRHGAGHQDRRSRPRSRQGEHHHR